MRRRSILFPVVVAVLLGLVAIGRVGPDTAAQEGTPPPFEIAPGVIAEAIAFAPGQETPSLYRLTFAPGVVYPIAPAPDISLVYAEAGSLTFTLDAPVTVTRAGASDAPGEAVAAGAEFTLGEGDYTAFPLLVGGEARNDGREAATVTVAAIVPPGMASPVAGTPAA